MEIETVIGDTSYSEKENIHYAKENELQLVSKLNPVITDGTRPIGHCLIKELLNFLGIVDDK